MFAAIQLLGFVVAGVAMTAPDPSRIVRDWSGLTIYPWWAALYVVVGVVVSLVSITLRDDSRALMVPAFLLVMEAQLTGLGLVSVKHWKPSFGMRGGYAGEPENLVRLACVVAVAAGFATLAAIGQLVSERAFPIRATARDGLLFGGTGALILLMLPLGIGEGVPELLDLTSLGAFLLIYSAPIGLTVLGAAWLARRLRLTAIASCAVAAAFSATHLITDLSYLHGRPALGATSFALAALAAGLAWRSRSPRLALESSRESEAHSHRC